MKICLVNPNYSGQVYFQRKPPHLHAPLGLLNLAGYLKEHKIDVNIIDANVEELSINKIAAKIKIIKPDVVGITCVTQMIKNVYSLCRNIKQYGNIRIILGGPHVTYTAEKTLEECCDIDAVVKGEGELPLLMLLQYWQGDKKITSLKNITLRENNKITTFPNSNHMLSIKELPSPAYEMIPLKKYFSSRLFCPGLKQRKILDVITSRGCLGKCTFCVSPNFWRKLRTRVVQKITTELEKVRKFYTFQHIDFWDDWFTFSRERTFEFCEFLKHYHPKVTWTCFARGEELDETLLKQMKESGCSGIQVGIETTNPELMKQINKRKNLEKTRYNLKIASKLGIKTLGSFIIGLPGESKNAVKEYVKYAVSCNLTYALFIVFTPYPGTKLAEKAGVKINDWHSVTGHKKVIPISEISKDFLVKKRRYAIMKFYFHPLVLWRRLYNLIKNPASLLDYLYLSKELVKRISFKNN